jgi:hypothetical protein
MRIFDVFLTREKQPKVGDERERSGGRRRSDFSFLPQEILEEE